MKSYKIQKDEKGITLIALIITIIILLILAMVIIRIIKDNKIIAHTNSAATKYKEEQEKELIKMGYAGYKMSKISGKESNLKIEGASTITGDSTNGWDITFDKTGNKYYVTPKGIIDGEKLEEKMYYGLFFHDQLEIISEQECKIFTNKDSATYVINRHEKTMTHTDDSDPGKNRKCKYSLHTYEGVDILVLEEVGVKEVFVYTSKPFNELPKDFFSLDGKKYNIREWTKEENSTLTFIEHRAKITTNSSETELVPYICFDGCLWCWYTKFNVNSDFSELTIEHEGTLHCPEIVNQ